MFEQTRLFIDGELREPTSPEVIEIVSPATEEVVGVAPAAGVEDISRAVAAARAAFDLGPWPRMTQDERADVIARAGKYLAERADQMDRLVTAQNGIVIRDHPGEAASSFAYYGSFRLPPPEHRGADGAKPTADGPSALIVHEPVGVVAAIVPWNAPVFIGLSKVLPALMTGNTVVLKPSPETPLQDYLIAEAFAAAGLPPGVLNVVPAHRDSAESLVRHPDVDLVSFTGSTAAGRRIGSICGEQVKRAVLELGGKSAAILLPDVDLAFAAPAVLRSGMLLNNGQACMAWSRILAPRSRYAEVVDTLVEHLGEVVQGDPMDPASEIGPLVADRQRQRVEGYIARGVQEGAKIAVGGSRPAHLGRGFYVEPTLFIDADNSMAIAREEIFGPVGVVIPYDDEAHAVQIANDSNYGLGGAVYSADTGHAVEVAQQLRTGTVSVNGAIPISHAYPFGGYKDSGIGRSHGPEGIAEYLEVKTIPVPIGYSR
jgi:aldehyde dehydrogenase (NAD+)